MERALYCPECGFYEKEKDKVGRAGDFYTSVSVGPLFGELLGFQFALWFAQQDLASLRLIEAGAHDGRLAADILNWLKQQRPEIFARTEYCLLEPSPRRRQWQSETLAAFADRVRWADNLTDRTQRHSPAPFTLIFSNELLDAMPLHRFGWDAAKRHWFEWGVAAEGERFVWTRLTPAPLHGAADGGFPELPTDPELLDVLPDGFTVEFSPAAEQWWRAAAQSLTDGKLLAFDYGHEATHVLLPERPNGTLRAYRLHKHVEDVLADPGEQDLTAHVNFTRIEQAGRAAGLKTETLETQGQFLTKLVSVAWQPASHFGGWDAKRTRQFQTLTHPEHLGRNFRVLVQSRGCNS
jgi:SAM-dependent MidA family methyltransferase